MTGRFRSKGAKDCLLYARNLILPVRIYFRFLRIISIKYRKTGMLFFNLCLLLNLSVFTISILLPILDRNVPVEADDAYSYIVMGPQLNSCFLQDCPALNSLRPQLLEPSSNPNSALYRTKEYSRLFLVYTPFHTVLMSTLHSNGLSWESSYNTIAVGGTIFLFLGIAYWLRALVGTIPAGIALFLFTFNLFTRHPIASFVPSDMALCAGIWTWYSVYRWKGDSYWAVITGSLIMIAAHPTGRLYTCVAIGIYVFSSNQLLSRRTWIVAMIAFLPVMISSVLPFIVSQPELSAFISTPAPDGWNYWHGLHQTIWKCMYLVEKQWGGFHGGALFFVPLVSLGFASMSRQRQYTIFITGLPLIGLLIASMFYVQTYKVAELFFRLWVPVSVLFAGIIGHSAWIWAMAVADMVPRTIREYFRSGNLWHLQFIRRSLVVMLLLLSGGYVGVFWMEGFQRGVQDIRTKQRQVNGRYRLVFDTVQPITLLSRIRSTESVLYMDELPMHFYFTYGLLQHKAVYFPGLDGTPVEKARVVEKEGVHYVVAWHPVEDLPICHVPAIMGGREGKFPLSTGDQLEFHMQSSLSMKDVFIKFENPGAAVNMDLEIKGHIGNLRETSTLNICVPPQWSNWLQITQKKDIVATNFSLEVVTPNTLICVSGISFDQGHPLNWPWDKGLTLFYRAKDCKANAYEPVDSRYEPVVIGFQSETIAPFLGRPIRILEDGGSTILGEII